MTPRQWIVPLCSTALASCAAFAQQGVPFPQPVISEVLFHVPNDSTGDANRDGVRDAVGDEFVELYNPHDRPIDLRGVVITSRLADPRNPGSNKGVFFAFPAGSVLAPGQCAVVFNGYDASIPGPVGTGARAPSGPSDAFGGALVYSVENRSPGRAMANSGGFALLSVADGGAALECVVWGSPKERPPRGTKRVFESERRPGGSVVRVGGGSEVEFRPCAEAEGVVASPGEHGGG